MLDPVGGYGALEIISDDKSRPVGVGEDDQSLFGGQTAKQLQLLAVFEYAEAGGLHNNGVHHLGEGVFVVSALHYDGLPDAGLHVITLRPADSSMSRLMSSSSSLP